jgi:hypothetical protein
MSLLKNNKQYAVISSIFPAECVHIGPRAYIRVSTHACAHAHHKSIYMDQETRHTFPESKQWLQNEQVENENYLTKFSNTV